MIVMIILALLAGVALGGFLVFRTMNPMMEFLNHCLDQSHQRCLFWMDKAMHREKHSDREDGDWWKRD